MFLANRLKGGRTFRIKEERPGGLAQMCPSPSSRYWKQGRGGRRTAAAVAGEPGRGNGREGGEKEEEGEEVRFPTSARAGVERGGGSAGIDGGGVGECAAAVLQDWGGSWEWRWRLSGWLGCSGGAPRPLL